MGLLKQGRGLMLAVLLVAVLGILYCVSYTGHFVKTTRDTATDLEKPDNLVAVGTRREESNLIRIDPVGAVAEQNLGRTSDVRQVVTNSSIQPSVYTNKTRKHYELVGQRILARLEDLRYADIKSAGHVPNTTRFVTIAVPTVNRPKVGPLYLMSTLDSLIKNSTPDDKKRMIVVVYLADKDPGYNQALLRNLTKKYPQYLLDGFMNIIQAPDNFYPDFQNLKQNFGDTVDRVKWRSREVIDSAYTYYMCRDLSKYFIQLEDDVASIPSFLLAVEEYIEARKHDTWAILDLSAHGSVGKLMKSADLLKMAIYMFTFYEEQPVDWLMDHFRHTLAQKNAFVRSPIIFQHMGKMSSFTKNGVRQIPKIEAHFKQDWKDV